MGMFWHGGPRVIRLVSGVVASMAVARHLGPEDYGALCFATMIATLAAGLVQIGSLEVVTKTSATHPEEARSLLPAALRWRLLGAILAGGMIALIPLWLGQRAIYWILTFLPITLVPECIEAVFYGRQEFRTIAPLRAISAVLGLILRLGLVAAGAGVAAFAFATVFEGGVAALMLLRFRGKITGGPGGGPESSGLNLFQQSLPLAASGILIAGMLRLDQFLLQALRPGVEMGYYYVVVRLFEAAGVLIPSYVSAILPDLARVRSFSPEAYREKMIRIYRRIYQAGLLIAGGSCLLAPWVIPLFFGNQYEASVPVFMAYSFAFPSFVVGSVRAMEFIISNKNQNHLLVVLMLLPFQALFCLLGIHWFGAAGLAGATALVSFISTTLFSMVIPALKESGHLQKEALKGILKWKVS
jgi:O-antigen/teichoic acid export membrane protein